MLRGVIVIARHELRLTLADRSAVLWLFLLPLVFATFFGLVLGGGGSDPSQAQARLTIVDHDGGGVARLLIDQLASERLNLVELTPEEHETAESLVRTLIIPEGFSTGVLAGEQATLRLEKEPDTSSEAALVAQARIVAAISHLVGRLVVFDQNAEQGVTPTAEALVQSEPQIDLVAVESRFAGRQQTPPDGFSQSIPGNTVMFVMLVALTYGAATLTAERSGGQLRRLVTAPVSRTEIVIGKIAGRLVVAWLQVSFLVPASLIVAWLIGVDYPARALEMWLVLLVYALAVAPLGVLFGAVFTDPDRAANIGVISTLVMAAFGGCWWPIEIVSPTLQKFALLFPTGWAMHAMHQVVSFGNGLGDTAPALAVLLGFSVVFAAAASRLLRVE